MLNYPSGPDIIPTVLTKRGRRLEPEIRGCQPLYLKMEKGVGSQRMQVASRKWEDKEIDSNSRASGRSTVS